MAASQTQLSLSRRQFLSRTLIATAAAATATMPASLPAAATSLHWPPAIVVFTKAYQVLGLNFDDSAALTAEAGLNGVDAPVRPKGEVEPERVEEDLPQYLEAL